MGWEDPEGGPDAGRYRLTALKINFTFLNSPTQRYFYIGEIWHKLNTTKLKINHKNVLQITLNGKLNVDVIQLIVISR